MGLVYESVSFLIDCLPVIGSFTQAIQALKATEKNETWIRGTGSLISVGLDISVAWIMMYSDDVADEGTKKFFFMFARLLERGIVEVCLTNEVRKRRKAISE